MVSKTIYAILNLDEYSVVASADSRGLAEQLIAQFEEEDIRNYGCEYEYEIERIPFMYEEENEDKEVKVGTIDG